MEKRNIKAIGASTGGFETLKKIVSALPSGMGVLTLLKDGSISRLCCHTGHAYTAEGLFDAVTDKIEEGIYSVLRGVDESIMLLNHLGDHFAEANYPTLSARYFRYARRASRRSKLLRQALMMETELEDNEELPPDF